MFNSAIYMAICFISFSVIVAERCPTPHTQKNFDINKFLGVWNSIQGTPNKYGNGLTCVSEFFESYNETTLTTPVLFTAFNQTSKKSFSMEGTVTWHKEEHAQLNVKWPKDKDPYTRHAYVLDIDYKSGLIYSCTQIDQDTIGILSREKTLDKSKIEYYHQVLKEQNLNVTVVDNHSTWCS